MKKWWIGCSGFYYKGWKEKFYPKGLPQSKWFEYYCESFNTIEINVTFYRFPRVTDLRGWYNRSPKEFMFSVKAPRAITHFRRFNNVTQWLQDFYGSVGAGLEDKLGAVLFQMHPAMEYSEDKLSQIVEALDPTFNNVLEFRHSTWWNNKVFNALKAHRLAFCGISYPHLPTDVIKSTSFMYYRFHGIPKLYQSSYKGRQLQDVVTAVNLKRNVDHVYVYFNNDIDVAAVRNAKTVQQLIKTEV